MDEQSDGVDRRCGPAQNSGVTLGSLTDYGAMRRFAVAQGMEDDGRDDGGIVAAWGAFDGARLAGTVCLERRDDRDTVNWLAVDAGLRHRGIATGLYRRLERAAMDRGVSRLWVTARAPGFFVAQGFRHVLPGPERDVLLYECLDCDQYGRECEPQALTKALVAPAWDDG